MFKFFTRKQEAPERPEQAKGRELQEQIRLREALLREAQGLLNGKPLDATTWQGQELNRLLTHYVTQATKRGVSWREVGGEAALNHLIQKTREELEELYRESGMEKPAAGVPAPPASPRAERPEIVSMEQVEGVRHLYETAYAQWQQIKALHEEAVARKRHHPRRLDRLNTPVSQQIERLLTTGKSITQIEGELATRLAQAGQEALRTELEYRRLVIRQGHERGIWPGNAGEVLTTIRKMRAKEDIDLGSPVYQGIEERLSAGTGLEQIEEEARKRQEALERLQKNREILNAALNSQDGGNRPVSPDASRTFGQRSGKETAAEIIAKTQANIGLLGHHEETEAMAVQLRAGYERVRELEGSI